jgi:hypothetical protein
MNLVNVQHFSTAQPAASSSGSDAPMPFHEVHPASNRMLAAIGPALLAGEVKNDIRFRDAADQSLSGRVIDNWQTL